MNEQKFSSQKLVLGLVLLAFGVLAFVDSTELWSPGEWWRLWPYGLIVLGLASELDALLARRGDGGAFLIAVGVWFLAARHQLFGLDHRTAIPLAIAVIGLFVSLHAIFDRPAEHEKEKEHESC